MIRKLNLLLLVALAFLVGLAVARGSGVSNPAPLAPLVNNFRLTLTSGSPVADATAATTIYCTPYNGNQIALYDGTATWTIYTSAEFSIALGTLTSGLPYDVFCYASGTTPTLELLAWTNATTRATALVRTSGVWSKTGATTRRYLGTFYTQTATTTEDSTTRRLLWNMDNRIDRKLLATDTTDTWVYTTATWRSANANTTDGVGRFTLVMGLAEDPLEVIVRSLLDNTSQVVFSGGVGIDSTSANSADVYGSAVATWAMDSAYYLANPGIGYHYIQRLEISGATGTSTWRGDAGVTYQLSGMVGRIRS